jgi:esterase/lipase superfamily enzyme
VKSPWIGVAEKGAPAAAVKSPGVAPRSTAKKAMVRPQSPAAPFGADSSDTAKLARRPKPAEVDSASARREAAPGTPPGQDSLAPEEATPWNPETYGSTKDYTVMTVFYGTDRKAAATSDARREGYANWFFMTAVCAVLTILVATAALRHRQSRRLSVLCRAGAAVTVLLGVLTTMARLRSEEINPGTHIGYGNERGEPQLGTCEVSVPKYHQAGEVERPSILRLDFKEDPKKHVVLLDVQEREPEEFFASLKANVGRSKSKEALVFVHGFNVTFEAAARRTAQLAYDLKFDGPPIFFSWPSQGGVLQYAVDETNVVWATPHLKDFLASVASRSGAKSVHLIAHSMGNRALTSALVSLAHRMKRAAPMFREVVLTAPDIDADVFKRDIAPFITRTAERVTLYASSNDEALALSKKLHGYARAGDSGAELVVVNGLDTIDVSNVDTSLLGHSYYGSNDTVLTDMFYVLTEPRPASQRRWLAPVSLGRLTYWVFRRAAANLGEATSQEKAVR